MVIKNLGIDQRIVEVSGENCPENVFDMATIIIDTLHIEWYLQDSKFFYFIYNNINIQSQQQKMDSDRGIQHVLYICGNRSNNHGI